MSTAEEVTSSTQQEDVYEFKTSSKEATPTSSRGSASPGGDGEGKIQNEEEEETGGKKRKKEEGGRGRGVRSTSSEKVVGKQGGRGRGAGAGGDRRSPPGSARGEASPAPSPGKGNAYFFFSMYFFGKNIFCKSLKVFNLFLYTALFKLIKNFSFCLNSFRYFLLSTILANL